MKRSLATPALAWPSLAQPVLARAIDSLSTLDMFWVRTRHGAVGTWAGFHISLLYGSPDMNRGVKNIPTIFHLQTLLNRSEMMFLCHVNPVVQCSLRRCCFWQRGDRPRRITAGAQRKTSQIPASTLISAIGSI